MAAAEEKKSKVLVIGGTGYIGKHVVGASALAGHPTFVLVRKATTDNPNPEAARILETFKEFGVTLLHGDLFDHQSLVRAIKQVDVVISTVGPTHVREQTRIVAAIKEAGNVKRFFPSEFGCDVDRHHAVEPARSLYRSKAKIRRLLESEGIPHTIVCAYMFAGYFVPFLGQAGFPPAPPRDKVYIYGDGNLKAVFVSEEDVGIFTIRAVDDPRTLNKILYLRPPANVISFNGLVALWEAKIGKTLERIHIPGEALLNMIAETPFPVGVAITHSALVMGDHTNFEIEPSFGVQASELYPDVRYTTVSGILDRFV